MTRFYKRVVHVFTNDLRLDDNPALVRANHLAVEIAFVFVIDPQITHGNNLGVPRWSKKRDNFLKQSLQGLSSSLQSLGHTLHILEGETNRELQRFIDEHYVDAVIRSAQSGIDEVKQWQRLEKYNPEVYFEEVSTHTLFEKTDLSFIGHLPDTFSKFRRIQENVPVNAPVGKPENLVPTFKTPTPNREILFDPDTPVFEGGESKANAQLTRYFSSSQPLHYKHTRNQLDGWGNSSKFSPWLANGCLSVRKLTHSLIAFEKTHGANESTSWLFMELLWREYFIWYAHFHREKLFKRGGLSETPPLTTYYAERFQKWAFGTTPWPLVNACMNELRKTGYMSNRGRQIVASCFVNELQLDWRYGAAFFEQHLLDYETGSNWGNWQYIAGVGADARGGRHFNIDKQTQLYDPFHRFIKRWSGRQNETPIDSVDYVDWPISSEIRK